MFGHVLHYTADDVDRLTVRDFHALCRWLDRYVAEVKKGQA